MRIERVALRRITLPLVSPFRTSLGIEYDKPALLVQVSTPDAEGGASASPGRTPATPRSTSTASRTSCAGT